MQELAVLASGALAAQRRFNATADNVANASTVGYRRLKPDFQEMVSGRSKSASGNGTSYVADRGILMDASQGTFSNTGNPFDLAIGGDGYFAINVNGNTQYTRRGQFVENSEGQLVTPEGYPLLDNAGAPFQLPTDAREFRVSEDGTISTEQGTIGQIGIFSFSPEQQTGLIRAGTTSYIAGPNAAPTVLENPSVKQGMLEASNVNAVTEMVDMNLASQAYQNSLKLLKTMEDTEANAISTLGKTN
ncbi:MAG TPA: flagellar hook basal-body protein [Alphaproteobacteria bacterium]|nr:flagellar hook basal-body protein [Alphaproteobacteria bacterium]